jgi:predicted AlkP superfamily pyrophosphatase or phosphodiesterase
MIPVFPSTTFANHYSIITGLYPESHGIINNNFYDPVFNESFSLKESVQIQPKWWEAEMIWETLQKQGLTSASYYWPVRLNL